MVKELQHSIQPASPYMSAPKPCHCCTRTAYGHVWLYNNRAEPASTLGRLTSQLRCGYVCPDLKT
ncbi:hypothetical protein J6590_068962 [Homalodisca vitripennis]|nr:hypothetical protein J6590_068962 [Homalodisca vitripennis]